MKRLTSHIKNDESFLISLNEKLIINKDFKPEIYFTACSPADFGCGLILSIATNKNKSNKRIDICTTDYTNRRGTIADIFRQYNMNIHGYYCNDNHGYPWWIYVMLFEEDALTFLNKLKNDKNYEFDLSDFFGPAENKCIDWPIKVGYIGNPKNNNGEWTTIPYSDKEINKFINDISK